MNLTIILQTAARNSNMLVVPMLIIMGVGLYFLPSLLGKNKRNSTSIFVTNLFFGWTFIGWVVALIWAVSKDEQPVVVNSVSQPAAEPAKSVADEITRFKQLLDAGAITQDEFDEQKRKLLNA